MQQLYRNMTLTDYVKVYEDAMPADMCQSLIDSFEADVEHQVKQDDGVKHFTEINLNSSDWYMDELYPLVLQYRQRYWSDCGITEQMIQPEHQYEELRMKRYHCAFGDQFLPHNDTYNLNTARRFLVYFWYLNTVEQGGETEFYRLEQPLKVAPVQGRLIMFPSTWQYLHAGLTPISNDKYILGGYFHYA